MRLAAILVLGSVLALPSEAQTSSATPQATQSGSPQAKQSGDPLFKTSIGMRKRIDELPISGTQLRAKQVADPQQADVIVRVLNVFRHGKGYRYNIEVTPFVQGTLDLRDHLERIDGSDLSAVPPLMFEVNAFLPPQQLQPNPLAPEQAGWVGGYALTIFLLALLWVGGLFAILFVGRKKGIDHDAIEAARPKTLADRLRPLVESAQKGELDNQGLAALERLLVAHWRRRRGLDDTKAGEAIAMLRRDEEAGALFLRLEQWLHAPQGTGIGSEDIAALLEPYRDVPDIGPGESA